MGERKIKIELITGIMGLLIFVIIYGVKVINPSYIGHMSINADLQQHYIGWCYFRNSSWHFPIGLMDGVIEPDYVSIIYTDSIPLFAIFFKLLSPVLPEQFQYFGLWGLLSAGLIGVLSGKILKLFVKSPYIICISSCFFILCPVFYRKMFGHTALAGIWILLLGLYLLIKKVKEDIVEKEKLWWLGIGILCGGIHMYYIPMLGIVLVGYCIADIWAKRDLKNAVSCFLSYVAGVFGMLILLGAFHSKGVVSGKTSLLGQYSANLNALINPLGGWSRVVEDLPVYVAGQYEGFAYLGLGIICLVIFSLVVWIRGFEKEKWNKSQARKIIPLASVLVISLGAALSPEVSINDMRIFKVDFPTVIQNLWSIFYACGRFIWIAMFFVMIFACCSVKKIREKKWYAVLLTACFALQIFDLSGKYFNIHCVYTAERTWGTVLDEENDKILDITNVWGGIDILL